MGELQLQLSKRWDKIDKRRVSFPVQVEIKFDGIRALIFRDEDEQIVLTRYEHEIPFEKFEIKEGVYDTEVWKPGKDFNVASGEIRKGDLSGVVVEVFDYLTKEEWEERDSPILAERRARLEKLYLPKPLVITQAWIANNLDEVEEYYKIVISEGMEGIMIKELSSRYTWDRKGGWYKYKKKDYDDAKIIDFVEGTGRLEGSLGALVVKLRDGRVTKVGAGFTDEQRDEIWKHKKKYLGKWVEIEFLERTKEAVRMPKFVRFKL